MKNLRSTLITGAAVGAAAIGGGAIASAASSSSSTTSTTSSAAPGAPTGQKPPANMPAHGTASHEGAEKTVTGTAAEKAKAAAIKSLGGGTAGTVTTDFTGDGYEVTVTKTNGTKVEAHLDKSFNVRQGPGGPGGPGMHGGPGMPGASGASSGYAAPSAVTG